MTRFHLLGTPCKIVEGERRRLCRDFGEVARALGAISLRFKFIIKYVTTKR